MVKYTAEKPANSTDLKFTGVRKRKWGKWVSEIRLPNSRERIWLGSYDSPEKAARAFDAAQFCLRGRSAKFNFPDNPPEIDAGRSLSPPEIQIAAARFANSEPEPEPPRKESENFSMEAESPSPSVVSDLTGQIDGGELMLDIPFLDLLANTGPGSSYYPNDYGIFPGFDDFQDVPLTEPAVDFGGEFFYGVLTEDSFLWNF